MKNIILVVMMCCFVSQYAIGQIEVRVANFDELVEEIKGAKYFNTIYQKQQDIFMTEGKKMLEEYRKHIESNSSVCGTPIVFQEIKNKSMMYEKKITDFEKKMTNTLNNLEERFHNYQLSKLEEIIASYKKENNIEMVIAIVRDELKKK